MLTLHQLEVLAAVVAEGSFSGAARRLGLTQPAISLQVRGLEEHFGCTLLERSGRTLRLTDAGQQAYQYATRLLDLLRDMETAVRSENACVAGRLHLCCSTTPGEYLLPRLLPSFRARHPRVELVVDVIDTAVVLERLCRRQCELALVGGTAHAERIDFIPFAQDDVVLAAPAGHPLASQAVVEPADLVRYPFVMREEGSGTRAAAEQALRQVGVTGLTAALVLGSSEAVKQAVLAGTGLAFISGCSLGEHDTPGLRVLAVHGLQIRRQLYVAVARDRPPGRLTTAFRQWLLGPEAQRLLMTIRYVAPAGGVPA